MRVSEARYRTLFENNIDAVFMTIPDGTTAAANPAACAMFGMTETEEELCRRGRQGLCDLDDPRLAPAGLIRPMEFRTILSVRRTEFTWALAAFAGVVLLGTLKGIIVAVVVSLVSLAYQVANPPVYALGRKPGTNVFRRISEEHPEDQTFPGLLLLKLGGRIFFANAELIAQKLRPLVDTAKPKVVVLDLSAVPDLEYTALKMLTEGAQRQRERGVSLWLVGLNSEVLAMVQRSSLGKVLGREAMHFNLETAVAKYAELSTRNVSQGSCCSR